VVTPDLPVRNGLEPLDANPDGGPQPVDRAGGRWLVPMRFAPGLSAMPAPPAVFLIVGLVLGPEGLGLLSPSILTTLDPVVSIAFAAIGALVGMSLQIERLSTRVWGAAAAQAVVPMALIAGSMFLVSPAVLPVAGAAGAFAAMLGIAGVSASTSRPGGETDRDHEIEQAAALRELVPIAIGGAAIAWFAAPSLASAAWLLLVTAGVSAATALLGWLLVSDTSSDAEQSVFALGVLLLLGGAAAVLSVSALLAGLVAGMLLRVSKSAGSARLAHDIQYMQHPLIVLLLVTAGAHVAGIAALWIVVGLFVASRTAGTVVAGGLTAWLLRAVSQRFDRGVLSAGLAGIACAFNLLQALPNWDVARALLAVAVAGAIVSDTLAVATRQEAA
jgi:hypothetical protein